MKDRIFTNRENHGEKDPKKILGEAFCLNTVLNFTLLLIFKPNFSIRYLKSFVQTLTFLSHMNL